MRVILFLLLTTLCFAQHKNLVVTYGLAFHEDEKANKGSDLFKVHLDYANANPNRFMFDLKIDSEGSFFELKNKLSVSEKTLSDDLALIIAKYPGIIFSFKDSILKRSELLGKNFLVKSDLVTGWTLTADSKEIDGYFCYKATNINRVKNSVGAFEHPVVAWYCPELPYSYGPIGYGNLPGLILQLQVKDVVYGIIKINFDSNDLPDYSMIKKSEIISEVEESKRLKKFFDNQEY